jgi:hypothetical protein
MMSADYRTVADVVFEYQYKTDSCHGVAVARDFTEAKSMLDEMVPLQAIHDGGWGWIEDQDGTRYCIAKENALDHRAPEEKL